MLKLANTLSQLGQCDPWQHTNFDAVKGTVTHNTPNNSKWYSTSDHQENANYLTGLI